MKQSTIIDMLRARHPEFTKDQIVSSVMKINAAICDTLARGGRIEIRGFGTFHLSKRPSREVFNPRARKGFVVPVRMVPRFKPAKRFKERIDGKSAAAGR